MFYRRKCKAGLSTKSVVKMASVMCIAWRPSIPCAFKEIRLIYIPESGLHYIRLVKASIIKPNLVNYLLEYFESSCFPFRVDKILETMQNNEIPEFGMF